MEVEKYRVKKNVCNRWRKRREESKRNIDREGENRVAWKRKARLRR